eukprot:scaffold10554_cov76-Skeletonema_dohrnii-CCMP3373.AAC.2
MAIAPPLNQPFKKWRVEEKEAPRAEKTKPPMVLITGAEAKVYATLKSDTIMHTHEDDILDIKIVGEKAHRHHHPQQSPYHLPYLLHLTQPAERKNDLTATLHSGVDVREVSGLHKQKTKPNSNRRTVEPLSSSFSSQSATLKKIELYSIPIIFFPISSSSWCCSARTFSYSHSLDATTPE